MALRNKNLLLFETVHGSRLYGLDHDESDQDFYRVYSGKYKSKQTIENGIDMTCHSLDSFMKQAEKGVPQALEAMFAPTPTIDYISAMRSGFNPNLVNCLNTYSRTIYNFIEMNTTKSLRHAMRLSMNLQDLYRFGMFNPTLNGIDRNMILRMSECSKDQIVNFCEKLTPLPIIRRD